MKGYNTVTNNKINDIGELGIYCAGVAIFNGSYNEVSYSDITDSARYATTVRGNMVYDDLSSEDTSLPPATGNKFEYLKVTNCSQDSGDSGAVHGAGINLSSGSYINYWKQITIDNSWAVPGMNDWRPWGIYIDWPSQTMHQDFDNIQITNTQGLDQSHKTGQYEEHFHSNGSDNETSATYNNCSWRAGFNSALISSDIGIKSTFPTEYLPKTVAYWPFDDNSVDAVDAIGRYSLDRLNSSRSTEEADDPLPNPDTGVFRIGNPATNRYSVNDPKLKRDVYDPAFAMRSDSSWTLEGYFKTDYTSDIQYIAGTRHQASSWSGWQLWLQTSGSLSFYIQDGSSNTANCVSSTGLNDDAWHHFAIVWDHDDGTNGRIKLYVDGVLAHSVAGIDDLGYDTTRRFAVGVRNKDAGGVYDDQPLEGLLDEFRWSNEALGPDDFLNDN